MTVVTVDGHQRMQEHLAAGDTGSHHALIDVGLEVLHHVDSAHEVVLVDLLQGRLELGIADIGLIGVVAVGVTMTHKGNDALFSLIIIAGVEDLGHEGHIDLSILQQGYTELQSDIGQILVIEVAVGIVGEVLDVVDHTGVLLTWNHLK